MKIDPTTFLAQGSVILGDVTLGKNCSVWYNAVIRGDHKPIVVGDETNIQDNVVFHSESTHPVTVGKGVTIGHSAIIHGCTIGDNTLIGMGAIIMNGAVVGNNCLIAAGALVTEGTVIPDGMLAMGSPAKVFRPLTEEEIEGNRKAKDGYVAEAAEARKYDAAVRK